MAEKGDDIELDTIHNTNRAGDSKGKKNVAQKIFTSPAVAIASFLFAAAQGELALVEHLLDDGTVKVNDCDYDKRTALHVACSEGHTDVVLTLLKAGADVNVADRYNTTPLDDAIHHGHIDISKLLLEHGAKHGKGTNFALDLVSAAGNGDLKSVERLIENGISVQSADYDLRTPLHVAIAGRHEEVTRYLLEHGANLDVEDRFGGTPLEEAHRAGVRLGTDSMLELVQQYSKTSEHHSWKTSFTNPFVITFLLIEFAIGTLFAIFSVYGEGVDAGAPLAEGYVAVLERYPFYMDVHVMIFVGFGFLMTFLRKYGYTAVGLTFILGALSIQVYLLAGTFWEDVLGGVWHQVEINIVTLIKSDFAAGAVLISFGALLGKITFTQMLLLAVLEVFFYSLNEAVAVHLSIADIGGSMVIHTFGAFFGLAASYALTSDKARGNRDNSAIYHSDIFSMIGTVFLWMYWPSFNAALGTGNSQHRAIVNTVLSLTGSNIFAFIFSQFWRKEKHFNMVDIQNATLAGGVAIGGSADMVLHPAFSLLVGAVSGTVSVFGFSKVQGFVEQKLGIHDTCGVLNLHGLPGIIGAIVSMIASAFATGYLYPVCLNEWKLFILHTRRSVIICPNVYRKFYRIPTYCYQITRSCFTSCQIGTISGIVIAFSLYNPEQLNFTFPARGDDRSASRQAQLQLAFLVITLVMAVITGFLCGKIISGCTFPKRFFVDSVSWETPSREVPYFFDIRGEAKHSNDKPDAPSTTGSIDEKIMERAINNLETKINALEDVVREQKRTIQQQGKLIGEAGASRAQQVQQTTQPASVVDNAALTTLLETLSNQVSFLVEKSKKDS